MFFGIKVEGLTQYSYQYDIAAIFVFTLLGFIYFSRQNLSNQANKAFVYIYIFSFVATVFDLLSMMAINKTWHGEAHIGEISNEQIAINVILATVYYLAFSNIAVLFYRYVLINIKKHKRNLFDLIICNVVPVINFAIILTNIFHKQLFYFNDNGYNTGFMLWAMYGLSGFVFLSSIILIFKNRTDFTKTQTISLVAFVLSLVIAIIIQHFSGTEMLSNLVASLFVLLVYFNLQTPDYYINKMCGCLNSSALIEKTEKNFDEGIPFKVVAFSFNDYVYVRRAIKSEGEVKLARHIGKRLRSILGKEAIYGLRDQKYVILLKNDENEMSVINIVKKEFEKEFEFEGVKINLSPYFCILNCPKFSISKENFVSVIETALYDSKPTINNDTTLVTNDYLKVKDKEEKIKHTLAEAIKEHKFEIAYQPIYDCSRKKFVSLEALLRIKDSLYGPGEFIPVAEKNGMIIDISTIAFEQVCKFIATHNPALYGIEYIEFNLSAYEFVQDNLFDKIKTILRTYNVSPSYLNFEITETADKVNEINLKSTMNQLASIGVTFSLDDYGTGYSSAKYLVDLPFSIIKIDKSILDASILGGEGNKLLDVLINTCDTLDKKIVVEGVENENSLAALDKYKHIYHQGFYYLKPCKEESIINFLKKQKK